MSLLTQFYGGSSSSSSGGASATYVTGGGVNASLRPGLLFLDPPLGETYQDTFNNWSGVTQPLTNYLGFGYHVVTSSSITAQSPSQLITTTGVSSISGTAGRVQGINTSIQVQSGSFLDFANCPNLTVVDNLTVGILGGVFYVPPYAVTLSNCFFGITSTISRNGTPVGSNLTNIETSTFTAGSNGALSGITINFAGQKLTVASVTKVIDDMYAVETSTTGGTYSGTIDMSGGTSAGLSSLSAATQAKVTALTSGGWTVTLNP